MLQNNQVSRAAADIIFMPAWPLLWPGVHGNLHLGGHVAVLGQIFRLPRSKNTAIMARRNFIAVHICIQQTFSPN